MKKIGIAMILWIAVECMVFPEILFPDCVGESQIVTQSDETIEENENTDYQFRSFLLKCLMKKKLSTG